MIRNVLSVDQSPRARWSLADLIDFEVALDATHSMNAADDSAIFVNQISPALGVRANDRSTVFLAWLHARKVPRQSSTGRQLELGVKAVFVLALFFGVMMGLVTTAGLLSHENSDPINAAVFLAGTVGLQLAIIFLVLVANAAHAVGFDFTPLTSWMKVLVRLMAGAISRLNGEQRTELMLFLAKTGERSDRLAPFVSLTILQLTQVFAIAFNIGILGSMLLVYLPLFELRFGWQSTYSFGPEAVFRIIQGVAAPWSWISDSLSLSLQQINATQFARGQSSVSLDALSARAWWPFLLSTVAFYGLMPRVVAAVAINVLLRWRLRRVRFEYPAANALWRRLHSLNDPSGSVGAGLIPFVEQPGLPHSNPGRDHAPPAHAALAIKSDDCTLSDGEVTALVHQSLGWSVVQTISACIDDDQLTSTLTAGLTAPPDAVVIVVPVTKDPIVAIAGFLQVVSESSKPGLDIVILLTGEPGSSMDSCLKIWSRFVAINRLRVGVELCR